MNNGILLFFGYCLLVVIGLIILVIKEFTKPKCEDSDKPVSCQECKCLINKSDSNIVDIIGITKYEYYYCEKCKPPYTKIVLDFYSDNVNRYYKEFQVDINGKIIK